MSDRVKTHTVRSVLARAFSPPEYEIAFEVRDAAGYAAGRAADAVVMGCWPSRGLDLTGVEIKVSRSDLRRELRDPAKAEAIAGYCDFFVIAAPAGLVDLAELPQAWGLWEIDLGPGRLRVVKKPERTDAQPLSRHLLAMLLRAHGKISEAELRDVRERAARETREDLEAQYQDRLKQDVEDRLRSVAQKERLLAILDKMVPKRSGGFFGMTDVDFARAVHLVLKANLVGGYGAVADLADDLERAAARIRDALPRPTEDELAEAGVEVVRPDLLGRKR